jgi:hypothetical protein
MLGRMAEEEAARFEEHCLVCAACVRYLSWLDRLVAAVRI